jgi:hypothetical protein
MGGVQWGSAADHQHVYVALSDPGRVMLAYTQFTDADRTRGGSLDGPGPIIAGGMLFVNSGYTVDGGMAGNVILAFSVDGQ